MLDVTITAVTTATISEAWDFVQEMDNWAPLLMGYQSHEKIDDRESIWKVKGDLGGLTRIAEFRVLITEWNGPERVRFELEGLDEPVRGSGAFLISGTEGEGVVADAANAPARSSWFRRLRDGFVRWLLNLVRGGRKVVRSNPRSGSAERAIRLEASTALQFELSLHAGGGTGPIMNLLLAPLLPTVAQDFAERIVVRLNARAVAVGVNA